MQFLLPDLGEGIQEAQVLRLLVAEGDSVASDQPLMEVETDKAAVEIPSPVAGTVVKLHVAEGEVVNVGNPLVTFDGDGDSATGNAASTPARAAPTPLPAAPATPAAPPAPAPVAPPPAPAHVKAAPVVRKLAHRLGVDLSRIHGSGKGGRVLREDVRRAAAAGTATPLAPPPPATAAAPPPITPPPGTADTDRYGPVRRQPLTQIRKTIAAQMTRSASTIPHVTNFEDADVTEIDRLRREFNGANPPERKLTLMTFVVQAVTRSLRRFPILNAVFDGEAKEIVYKEYVNLGVAVDSERGLVVPVMRDVHALDLHGISTALKVLAEKVRTVSFAVEELRGSSFTISNAGTAGGTRYATPIINYPETAILSLGRARTEPRYVDGELKPRLILPLSLSFDHRAVDGAESARFLADVIDQLERPGRLLL